MTNVLIVDDSDAIRTIIKACLGAGFDCQGTRSLFDARLSLEQSMPHLAFVADWLPDGDGFQIVREMRAFRARRQTLRRADVDRTGDADVDPPAQQWRRPDAVEAILCDRNQLLPVRIQEVARAVDGRLVVLVIPTLALRLAATRCKCRNRTTSQLPLPCTAKPAVAMPRVGAMRVPLPNNDAVPATLAGCRPAAKPHVNFTANCCAAINQFAYFLTRCARLLNFLTNRQILE